MLVVVIVGIVVAIVIIVEINSRILNAIA